MTNKEIAKKYRRSAWRAILIPTVTLFISVSVWGLIGVIDSSVENSQGIETLSNVLSVLIPIILLFCVLFLIPGIFFSIRRFRKAKRILVKDFDERSGMGEDSTIPEEIKKWSWGAFGLSWIWGISHGLWISMLFLVPVVNVVFAFVFGAKARSWAWKKEKWESVASFKRYQKIWNIFGVIFFIFGMLALLFNLLLSGVNNSISSDSTNNQNLASDLIIGSESITEDNINYSVEYFDLGKEIDRNEVEAINTAILPKTQGNFVLAVLKIVNVGKTEVTSGVKDFMLIDQDEREYEQLRQIVGVQGVYLDGQKITFSWASNLYYPLSLKPGIPKSKAILFEVAEDSNSFYLQFSPSNKPSFIVE